MTEISKFPYIFMMNIALRKIVKSMAALRNNANNGT